MGFNAVRLLLVEDDFLLGEALHCGLVDSGYTVAWFRDGEAADQATLTQPFDMVLLDLGLPGCDGLSVLRRLRTRGNTVPVIILTARTAVNDRVTGLDCGADAYVSKPFVLGELEARIRALARRLSGQVHAVMLCGNLELNLKLHEARFQGRPLLLTRREYQILEILIRSPGVIFTRSQLEYQLYGRSGVTLDSNAIEATICRLRQKTDSALIKTVRGRGYQLVKP